MTAVPSIPAGWALAELLSGFAPVPVAADVHVERLTLDSRDAGPGALFLACSDGQGHGLEQAAVVAARGCAAIAAEPDEHWPEAEFAGLGAELGLPVVAVPGLGRRSAAIAARFFSDPSARMTVFGVIGAGDTAPISHFLAQVLGDELRCGVIGRLGSGFPGESCIAEPAGADPVRLQAHLASLAARGAGAIALECPPRMPEDEGAAAVRLSHVIVADPEAATGDLGLPPEQLRPVLEASGLRSVVLNHDDPACRALVAAAARPDRGGSSRVVPLIATARQPALHRIPFGPRLAWYSLDPSADLSDADVWVRAERVEALPAGLELRVTTSAGAGAITLDLIGLDNAAGLLAVLAMLLSRGIELDQSLAALAGVRGVPGRMEGFGGAGVPLVVVDGARTPEALARSLTQLRGHSRGRLITVFGCDGASDPHQRARMGAIAQRLSDAVIVTDDNPRGGDGAAICADIVAGMQQPAQVPLIRQRGLAIRHAIALAGPDDTVLVAGKGRETVQDMGELKIRFSDRAQVVQALGEWQGFGA